MYRTAALPATIVTVLALAACGGGDSSTQSTNVAQKTVKAQEKPVASRPAKGDTGACQARLADFLDRMDDLRQSLLAGLTYDEYVVRLQAIRAAYEAIPVEALGARCVTGPAAQAEDAFNQYLRAANAWGECAATAGCAASDVEGKLQHRWKLASKSLDAAETRG